MPEKGLDAFNEVAEDNARLQFEIERLRKAIEYACHSLDLGRITSTVASELRAAVGQATSKEAG